VTARVTRKVVKNWARLNRKRFLEERLTRLIERVDGDGKANCRKCGRGGLTDDRAVSSIENTVLRVRKELDVEVAKLEVKGRKAPATIAEQVAQLKRKCEKWPDALLVAVVEVYCARYKLDMPRPLRTVGG
jgi:hypothetical protein